MVVVLKIWRCATAAVCSRLQHTHTHTIYFLGEASTISQKGHTTNKKFTESPEIDWTRNSKQNLGGGKCSITTKKCEWKPKSIAIIHQPLGWKIWEWPWCALVNWAPKWKAKVVETENNFDVGEQETDKMEKRCVCESEECKWATNRVKLQSATHTHTQRRTFSLSLFHYALLYSRKVFSHPTLVDYTANSGGKLSPPFNISKACEISRYTFLWLLISHALQDTTIVCYNY